MALPLSTVAKSRAPDEDDVAEAERPSGYFHWSREASMGLFAVMPLWLCYLVMRWQLAPDERNGAELFLLQQIGRLGESAHLYASAAFVLMTAVAARSLIKHKIPWSRVAAVIALEGLVYGVSFLSF